MAEPSRRASRLTIAGGALALIAAGAGGFVLGRSLNRPAPPPPPRAVPAPAPVPPPAPVLKVQPPLGRAELIAAAARAADAVAAGQPLPADLAGLAGRDFELRLPFACPGAPPGAGAGSLGAEYDRAAEALRVRAQPVRWMPGDWLPPAAGAGKAGDAADAMEGFWIARPWTSSDACPAAAPPKPPGAAAPAPPEPSLGIAQVFTAEGSRVGRRDGKAYAAVKKIAPDKLDTSRGLRLRLRGKLALAAGAGPILCRAPGGGRPVCLVLATLDQVAIDNPATGETIATWDVSSQSRDAPGD